MRQLTIISGKGGTGKTSICAAFASLAYNTVLADCDVDAADLHLILKPTIRKTETFYGLNIACINKDSCIDCKKCFTSCKYNAITTEIKVKMESCEGCGVCEYVCPVDAISMKPRAAGHAYVSETRFAPMSHADLFAAEEASGKLVTEVRTKAKKLAEDEGKDLILIDGPPGIGCPVISSITGVDLVLIVTEPTLSAIHDLQRILDVAHYFNIPAVVCINKYDINFENTKKIENFCIDKKIDVVGKIPYDTVVTDAMVAEKSVIEFSTGNLNKYIGEMWHQIKARLGL